MSDAGEAVVNRADRRRLRTRAALVSAAQTLLAEGRESVAIAEITKAADIGLGSFYNHFDSRDQLFAAALDDALEKLGDFLDAVPGGPDDPAVAFSRSFRLVGRVFRRQPQLSRLLLRNSAELMRSELGLAPRALRDITAAIEAGRFRVHDPRLALAMAAGALTGLGTLVMDDPDVDDAEASDWTAERLLLAFGMSKADAARVSRAPLPDLRSLPSMPEV